MIVMWGNQATLQGRLAHWPACLRQPGKTAPSLLPLYCLQGLSGKVHTALNYEWECQGCLQQLVSRLFQCHWRRERLQDRAHSP
jgi:hypothetical protein